MSHLISRILLAVLMLPLTAMVYLAVFVPVDEVIGWNDRSFAFPFAGLVSWAFIAMYWTLLWRKSVRMNAVRVGRSFGAGVMAALVAAAIAISLAHLTEQQFGSFMGSALAPLLWIVATIFLWRETPIERAERLRTSGRDGVVCPTCGYNLTGLTSTRCPECGSQFTLDELMAAQPGRESAELE
jgi:hypothetical protein